MHTVLVIGMGNLDNVCGRSQTRKARAKEEKSDIALQESNQMRWSVDERQKAFDTQSKRGKRSTATSCGEREEEDLGEVNRNNVRRESSWSTERR